MTEHPRRTILTLAEVVKSRQDTDGAFTESFWSRVDRSGQCWEWTRARFSTGYGAVWFKGKTRKAHRVAYELTAGPLPEGVVIRHSCDNPACVRPDHLLAGAMRDNTADMLARGRGGRHGRRRLDPEKVREIRARRASGETLHSIAVRYGVSSVAIHLVCARKTWRAVA